jgi:ketosteroid isomerase-like protein
MQPSAEVSAVISGWFDAVAKGDLSWPDRHISTDEHFRVVGTDPKEWLSGKAAFDFLRNEAEALAGKVTVKVAEIEGFSEGDVGWGLAAPEITFAGGPTVKPRWSAVLRRENGIWKLIQVHSSFPVSNQDAFGGTPA